MVPIKFQVVGEEDYAYAVEVHSTGAYVVSSGTYTTEPPRKGKLTEEQERELLTAIEALGTPAKHPVPEGAEAFEAQLVVGEEGKAVTYPFWEGALEEDTKLRDFVRLLETL